MPKKLAVGTRRIAMAGKPSATKRELIDAGEKELYAKRTRSASSGPPKPKRRTR